MHWYTVRSCKFFLFNQFFSKGFIFMIPDLLIPFFRHVDSISPNVTTKWLKTLPNKNLMFLLETISNNASLMFKYDDLSQRVFRVLSTKFILGKLGQVELTFLFLKILPRFATFFESSNVPQTKTHLLFHRHLYNNNSFSSAEKKQCVDQLDLKQLLKFLPLAIQAGQQDLQYFLCQAIFEMGKKDKQCLVNLSIHLSMPELLKILELVVKVNHCELQDELMRIITIDLSADEQKKVFIPHFFSKIVTQCKSINLSKLKLADKYLGYFFHAATQCQKLIFQLLPRKVNSSPSEEDSSSERSTKRANVGSGASVDTSVAVREVLCDIPKQLTSLTLFATDLVDNELKVITYCCCSTLTELFLIGVHLNRNGWEAIARLKKLKKLHLLNCKGYENALDKIAGSCEALNTVIIQENQQILPLTNNKIIARINFNRNIEKIKENDPDAVQDLLNRPDITTFVSLKNRWLTFLHAMADKPALAAMRENVIEVYLKAGGDPNALDLNGCTPLIRAVKNRNVPFVAALLDKGNANPNISALDCSTALSIAILNQDIAIKNILLNNPKMDLNNPEILFQTLVPLHNELYNKRIVSGFSINPFILESRSEELLTPVPSIPRTVLEAICKEHREKLYNLLLEKLQQKVPFSFDTLEKFLDYAIEIGDPKLFDLIISMSKPDLKMNRLSRFGGSLLQRARRHHNKAIEEVIKEKGGTIAPELIPDPIPEKKFLGHCFGIKGDFVHNNTIHKLEGFQDPVYVYAFLSKALIAMTDSPKMWEIFKCIPQQQRVPFRNEIINFARAIEKAISTQSAEEIMDEIRKGNPVILNTIIRVDAQSTHSIPIMLYNLFLFLCNRGAGLDETGKSKCIAQPTGADTITYFVNALQHTNYKLRITEFSRILSFLQVKVENKRTHKEYRDFIENFILLNDPEQQKVGNCLFANIEGLFKDFLIRVNPKYSIVEADVIEQQFKDCTAFIEEYAITECVHEKDIQEKLLKENDPVSRKVLMEKYLSPPLINGFRFDTFSSCSSLEMQSGISPQEVAAEVSA